MPHAEVQPRGLIAILSPANRSGDWVLPAQFFARAFFGHIRLDLRRARFLPGTSVIDVTAIMGQVDITLPHGVRVECDDFKVRRLSRGVPRQDAPCIRIVGGKYMGEVRIKVVDPDTGR